MLRHTLPFVLSVLLSQVQTFFHGPAVFWIYGLKVAILGIVLFFCFKNHVSELTGPWDWKAPAVGLGALLGWIFLTSGSPDLQKPSFDPAGLDGTPLKFPALFLRVLGASLIVPLIEETFWRSFFMRFLIARDFLTVPIGAHTPLSFWVTAFVFAGMHAQSEWLAALACGILYGAYLVRTKNLAGAVTAHAVTNLGLACYVLATGRWALWG